MESELTAHCITLSDSFQLSQTANEDRLINDIDTLLT